MKILKNLLLLLVSLSLTVVAGEYVVRFALADITSTANMQTWFGSRWQAQYVSKNSLGYREREVVMPKPEGVYRIVMLGDSFGYGQGLPVDERFSALLEQALNSQSGADVQQTFEILNFSIPGATSLDQLKVFEEVLLPLEPDFVLVQWLPNDFEDQTTRWNTHLTPLMPNDALHRKWQRRYALYFLLNTQWQQLKPLFGIEQLSYEEKLLLPFANPGSEEYAKAAQPLDDFLTVLNDSGVDYAFVLHPILLPNLVTDNYLMQPLHDLTLSMCEQANARCLDLSPPFIALGEDYNLREMWVNRFDPHPGREANRMVADYILQELAPQAWGYRPD